VAAAGRAGRAVATVAAGPAAGADRAVAVVRAAAVAAAAAAVARAVRPREAVCDHPSGPRPFWLAAKRRRAASLPDSLFAARDGRGPKE
jgi:hypothetical protein